MGSSPCRQWWGSSSLLWAQVQEQSSAGVRLLARHLVAAAGEMLPTELTDAPRPTALAHGLWHPLGGHLALCRFISLLPEPHTLFGGSSSTRPRLHGREAADGAVAWAAGSRESELVAGALLALALRGLQGYICWWVFLWSSLLLRVQV